MLHFDFSLKLLMSFTLTVLLFFNIVFLVFGVLMLSDTGVLGLADDILAKGLEIRLKLMNLEVDTEDVSLSIFFGPMGKHMIVFGCLGGILVFGCYSVLAINFYVCSASKLVFIPIAALHLFLSILLITYVSPKDKVKFQALKPGDWLHKTSRDTLEQYKGAEFPDKVSVTWSAVMAFLKCCGVDGKEDFQDHNSWKAVRDFDEEKPVSLEVPLMCCKFPGPEPKCYAKPEKSSKHANETTPTVEATSKPEEIVWKGGCYTKLWNFVFSSNLVVVTVFLYVGIQILFIAMCVLALLLAIPCPCRPRRVAALPPNDEQSPVS